MVRLKDMAERAGVSIMTVSKALRDARDVSESTKARIKTLAQQMGYVPNSTAQGLRSRTTRLFGLVIPGTTHPIYGRVSMAIEQEAYQLGYDLLLAHTHNNVEREEAWIRRLLSRRVDGMFISPVYRMEPEARIYKELQARQIPVVLVGAPASFCRGFVSVQSEELVGSYGATRGLLKLGHKRIAFLTGPTAAPWSHERFEGYRRALRELGMEVDDRLVFQAGETIQDGTNAAIQMINEKCNATAIQAVTDAVAVGCAGVFLKQGIRIPEEISIVGFGNTRMGEYFQVPLDSVRQHRFLLGKAAVELMMQLLRGERAEPRRLPADLVSRASTGPAPPERQPASPIPGS